MSMNSTVTTFPQLQEWDAFMMPRGLLWPGLPIKTNKPKPAMRSCASSAVRGSLRSLQPGRETATLPLWIQHKSTGEQTELNY
jgi:hypothetical protein